MHFRSWRKGLMLPLGNGSRYQILKMGIVFSGSGASRINKKISSAPSGVEVVTHPPRRVGLSDCTCPALNRMHFGQVAKIFFYCSVLRVLRFVLGCDVFLHFRSIVISLPPPLPPLLQLIIILLMVTRPDSALKKHILKMCLRYSIYFGF